MKLSDYIFEVLPKVFSYNRARKAKGEQANPLTITYSVTAACRSLCKTCNIGRVYLDDPDIAKQDLSIAEIEKIFKSLGHVYFFNVSGGEPFMRIDLPEILRLAFIYLKPRLISIPTNSLAPKSIEKATLKILEYMDQYLPSHVPLSIKPSIDGVGEMHDYVRGIKGNFVKLDETIQRLLNIRKNNPRLHVDLGSVISNYNLNHLDELEEWVHSRGIESYRHEIAEQRVEFHNIGDPITPSADVYRQLTDRFSKQIISNIKGKGLHTKITESIRLVYYEVANRILKEKKQVTPCYGGTANIHLNFNGDVWPCCILGSEQLMGNIREWDYDFQKLLHSDQAKKVIKYIADKNCACPLASQWLNNILLTPKHMLKVFYILLIKFPFASGKAIESKSPKIDPDAIILSKAGTISDPQKLDKMVLESDEKTATAATSLSIKEPFTILNKRILNDKVYILRIPRHGLDFIPGQYFVIGENEKIAREYTIYSGLADDYLEFMITEVIGGEVSPRLKQLENGTQLQVEGPLGYFALEQPENKDIKHIFIATGSGVAPFHSFIKSYPNLNYQLIHGVRKGSDLLEQTEYGKERYIVCSSRDDQGDFQGRVTDYLSNNPVDSQNIFYICGNCDMLYDVYDILISQGVTRESIKAEVFY